MKKMIKKIWPYVVTIIMFILLALLLGLNREEAKAINISEQVETTVQDTTVKKQSISRQTEQKSYNEKLKEQLKSMKKDTIK